MNEDEKRRHEQLTLALGALTVAVRELTTQVKKLTAQLTAQLKGDTEPRGDRT